MAKGGKRKRTETDEAGNGPGPGRPPLPEGESRRRRNEHNKKFRANKKFERERFEAFVKLPENTDKYEAFKEYYSKRNGESSKKDGTNESFDTGMLTGSSIVASNNEGELQSSCTWTTPLTVGAMNSTGTGVRIGTRSEPPIWGREEELAEVRKGKMLATGGNCTPPVFPIGGSRSSKFMVSANQPAHQSAFAGNSNWKVVQYAQKQHMQFEHEIFEAFVAQPENNDKYKAFKEDYRKRNGESSKDTYVAKCPSSHGLDQIQLQQQISEMQAHLQWMVDNFDTMVQRSIVALAPYGFFQQTNAPTVSPAVPCHDPLSVRGGTNAATGSSGDATNQSFPHNEEEERERIFSEELNNLGKAIVENLANQYSEKDLSITSNENLEMTQTGGLEGVTDMNSSSFGAMGTPFEPEGKCTTDELGKGSIEGLSLCDLLQDEPLYSPGWYTLLNSLLEPEMPTGNLAGSSNVASTGGGKPRQDHLGTLGETTAAAGSSGSPTTQFSSRNEKF